MLLNEKLGWEMFPRRGVIVFASLLLLGSIAFTLHRVRSTNPGFLSHLSLSSLSSDKPTTDQPQNERVGNSEGEHSKSAESTAKPCSHDLGWLDSIGIDYPIRYAQRNIIAKPNPKVQRDSMIKIGDRLFPDAQTVSKTEQASVELRDCQPPLVLDVPVSPPRAGVGSQMIFGIATTVKRLEESTPQIARWLAHTKARLFVIIIKPEKGEIATSKQIAVKQGELREMGLDVTLVTPLSQDELYTETYFSLVKVLYNNRKDDTSWFVLMDDDTFFPSVGALVDMLAKYDPAQQYWVGAVSEMWWSVARYGMMAFGGAGIFLSRALAKAMDGVYPQCITEMHPAAGGDERVMRCVYGHTETKLTNEPNLHQMDIFGDLSGVYESGRLPLSLHHWKGGEYPVGKMSLVQEICGNCFLQRWQFGEDTVLSNGYSIAKYPEGEKANGLDFGHAEKTWDSRTVEESVNEGTWHSMSPMRPRLVLDKQKIQYKLVESSVLDGKVRQSYLHKSDDDDLDTLLVLYWEKQESGTLYPNQTTIK